MALFYVIASVSYGLLCSLCWLLLGGPVLPAILVYLISGQFAMITLVWRAYVKAKRASEI